MSEAWREPTYRQTTIPGPQYWTWVTVCSSCDAVVINPGAHTDWHYQLHLALGGAPR